MVVVDSGINSCYLYDMITISYTNWRQTMQAAKEKEITPEVKIGTRVLHHSRNEFGTVEGMSFDEYNNPFADIRWDNGEFLGEVNVVNLLVVT